MEHLHVERFVDYHAFLEAHPQEFVDLLNTVLINVTSFFRDPDAWDALKTQVLPQLVAPERGRDQLRLWSVGCATATGTLFARHAALRALGAERIRPPREDLRDRPR